jgi:serine/threonine-protein kinase
MAREREILASLNHPHIARLYDAGCTSTGQPYLALEYVAGKPIDEYADENRLAIPARLRIFQQVARAVAHAHARLIVHRDLKPSNIMVTHEGEVKLLDFGIAKLIEAGAASASVTDDRALTPDYASPEQILGMPITVASDVYSLGVLLYELLTTRRPYKLVRASRGALEDAILQADPAPPSTVAPAEWRKALRGDLDTIVLKALRKAHEDRYATADALADDLDRYLERRPVLAQPDSRAYRARKFIARNTLAVGAGCAIAAALIVGTAVAVWQARVARVEQGRAMQVQQFIAEVFQEADPTQGKGKSLSAVELLLQAERRLAERHDIPPAQRLELLAIMGESLFGLQDNGAAARVLESALRQHHAQLEGQPAMAARLRLALSQSYEYLGRNDEAAAELRKVFAALATGRLVATPLHVRAKLHESALGFVARDYALAERAADEALAGARAAIGPRSPEAATALQLLSKAYIFSSRAPLAVERSREALDLMLANYRGDFSHPRVIDTAQYYANALTHVGDFDTAAKLMRDITARAAEVLGHDSRLVGELSATAIPAELERGDLAAATALARHAVDVYVREAEPESLVHAYRVRLLGHVLVNARADEATTRLEEALRLSIASKTGVPFARAGYGLALAYAGRLAEAEDQLRQSLAEAAPGSRPMQLAARNLGTLLRLRGDHPQALAWIAKANAAAAADEPTPMDRNDLAIGLVEEGLADVELRNRQGARTAFERAAALFAASHGNHLTPARADLLLGIARVRMQDGDFAAALPDLERADAYWRDAGAQNRWAGEAALWLGRCQRALGHAAAAERELRRAQSLLARSPLPADAQLAREAGAGR